MPRRYESPPGQLAFGETEPKRWQQPNAKAGTVVAIECRTCAIEFRVVAGEQAEIERLCTPCWYQSKEQKGKKR